MSTGMSAAMTSAGLTSGVATSGARTTNNTTVGATQQVSVDAVSSLTNMMSEVQKQIQLQSDTSAMLMNQVTRLQKEMNSLITNVGSMPPPTDAFGSSMTIPASGTTVNPIGNPTNNLTGSPNPNFNNNFMNPLCMPNMDAGYAHMINMQLLELRNAMLNVPGVTLPYHQASPTCYNESRFTPAIASVVIPKKFTAPSMKQYDGSTDPLEHIALYQEKMNVAHIPLEFKEACLCRGFGSTLSGSALKWLTNQPLNSIGSYAQLVNMFTNQFSCNRVFERRTSDLYRVVQQPDELLKDYLSRFNREVVTITNLDMTTAVEAFRMGLKKDSRFYDDLVMIPCRNLEEARTRATKFIRLEEDKLMRLERDNLMQDYLSKDWNGGMQDDNHGWYQNS